VRAATTWTLGYAYHLKGERMAADRAYAEARTASRAIGHSIITLMATLGLGNLQEEENQLRPAEETYRHVLELAGSPPLSVACEAHLGLARINYMWNDLESAQLHGRQALQLARQISNTDRAVATELFLARLTLAQGDAVGAATLVAQAAQTAHQHNFVQQLPEVATVQVLICLRQGNLSAAAQWAEAHDIPLNQARVQLATGATAAALDNLAAYRQRTEARGWADEQLRTITLQAVAARAHGDRNGAIRLLVHALALAEPGGFIRIFVDEGPAMAQLLGESAVRQASPDYAARLLAAFGARAPQPGDRRPEATGRAAQPLIEPLSERELEVLQLMARGLSNREIGEQLFLAEDTVKGHNRRIFGKLQVRRRTEAVAKARSLRILPHDE
jgi:LuxR family maltose regulon positive regulatory protein